MPDYGQNSNIAKWKGMFFGPLRKVNHPKQLSVSRCESKQYKIPKCLIPYVLTETDF